MLEQVFRSVSCANQRLVRQPVCLRLVVFQLSMSARAGTRATHSQPCVELDHEWRALVRHFRGDPSAWNTYERCGFRF